MDTNVERVKAKLDARSQRGIAKYGVATDRAGLSPREWLTHLHEEMMDAVIYLEAHLAASAGAEVRDLTPEEAAASLERLDATLDRFAGRTRPAAASAEAELKEARGEYAAGLEQIEAAGVALNTVNNRISDAEGRIEKAEAEAARLREALEAIRDYQPTEVAMDRFAYDRMVESCRDAARAALRGEPA